MIKLIFASLLIMPAFLSARGSITLSAIPDASGSVVSLRWNMVNYSSGTAYVLLRSIDGVVWQIAAANPVFRNYTSSTIMAYNDKIIRRERLYYKVRIYDHHDNTVATSNTAIAQISKAIYSTQGGSASSGNSNEPAASPGKTWKIYPNPVHDMLNISYNKRDRIMGVINVFILGATGKILIRFRQASNNKQIRIPVGNLRAGLYFIKINVLNEMQMNERFIKQ